MTRRAQDSLKRAGKCTGWSKTRCCTTLPSRASGPDWLDKQRLLLADMALHLLQTARKPGEIALDKLRNSLHAILTISDQFLPHAELKDATSSIYRDTGEPRL